MTEQVPERDFHGAQGGHEHWPAAIARAYEHAPPVAFNLCRVLADQVALVRLNRRRNHLPLVRQGALSETGQALVGIELHKYEILIIARIHEKGLEVGNSEVKRLDVFEAAL